MREQVLKVVKMRENEHSKLHQFDRVEPVNRLLGQAFNAPIEFCEQGGNSLVTDNFATPVDKRFRTGLLDLSLH